MDKYTSVNRSSVAIPVQVLVDIEQQNRRALLALASVDSLTEAVRRIMIKMSFLTRRQRPGMQCASP